MTVRVVIVEDSGAVRILLEHILTEDRRFEVVGSFESAEDAIPRIPALRPDVISMDVSLPGMSGLEATREIMQSCPTPTVVVSARAGPGEMQLTMDALHAGALAAVEKPAGPRDPRHRRLSEQLRTQLALMSGVRVVRQRRFRGPTPTPAPLPARAARAGDYDIVGLVASTGGPRAIERVLAGLPPEFSLPILLVQHMGDGFLDGFVDWLAGLGGRRVCKAEAGTTPQPGVVHVAPAGKHLSVVRGRFRFESGAPVHFHRPSGTVLLRSMAESYGDRAIGVVLTGMGEDGAAGLAALQQAGGHAIVEDESTAVVASMPRAAREAARPEVLRLGEIGTRLASLQAGKRAVR